MSNNPSSRHWYLFIFLGLVGLYSFFQARFLIIGPQVEIMSPRDGTTVGDPLVTIEGVARNIAWLSLNGRQIFTDEEGSWSERLVVEKGVSTMTVRAKDRFGRESEEKVRIILN